MTDAINFNDHANTQLNDELQSCVDTTGVFPMFRHPLFVTIYSEKMNSMINTMVNQRKKYFQKLNFVEKVHFVERMFQFEYLVKHFDQFSVLKEVEQWQLIDYVWTNSENPSVNLSLWESIFSLMPVSPFKETTQYEKMKSEIVLYRGGNREGLSWTSNKDQAIWFANRFKSYDQEPMVWEVKINKNDIYHYTDSRGEDEFIVDSSLTKNAFRII
ncbi:hypothetical protein [Photobacterium leiognathi]|uniref:hypothetical protein n=2 Tax=Photobacterium leiognathi TaxID=553611 RepID=UPI002982472B|nr:hypothetical protein [Photobacterium leiognathi]